MISIGSIIFWVSSKYGKSRVITPVEQSWDAWFDLPVASDYFMRERDQPSPQERKALDD